MRPPRYFSQDGDDDPYTPRRRSMLVGDMVTCRVLGGPPPFIERVTGLAGREAYSRRPFNESWIARLPSMSLFMRDYAPRLYQCVGWTPPEAPRRWPEADTP